MKQMSLLLFIFLFVGCSNTDYDFIIKKGYRKSVVDRNILTKHTSDSSYYKFNLKDPRLFLVLEKHKDNVLLKLGARYVGVNWIYMDSIILTPKNNLDNPLKINFLDQRFMGALSNEKTLLNNKVSEEILISLTEDIILKLENLLNHQDTINIIFEGSYNNNSIQFNLNKKEKRGLQQILAIYNKTK